MVIIKSINLLIRFLLELCLLGALGYWGFSVGRGLGLKLALGIGAPLLIAVLWATVGAPKADVALPAPLHLVLELVVFGSGVAALYAAKQPSMAWTLGLTIVLNRILMFVWGQ